MYLYIYIYVHTIYIYICECLQAEQTWVAAFARVQPLAVGSIDTR